MADRYWVGASGAQWNTVASWSTTSGGPSGASVPTAADSVFFDQAGTFDVVMIGSLACLDFNVTAGALTFSNTGPLTISGSMAISNVTPAWTASATLTFNATTAKTIQSNGVSFAAPITFNGAGGTWTLSGNLTTAGIVTLLQGSIDLDGNILSGFRFASSSVNTRAIAFGLGKIVLSGAATVWTTATSANLTITGTPVVDLTYALADPVTVSVGASLSESSSVSFNVTAGTYALTLTGNPRNIDFTGFAGSLLNGTRTIFGNLTLSSGMTLSAGAGVTTFAATSGVKTITTNGKLVDFPVTFNGVGGTWQLQDALTLGATRVTALTNGTLDLNAKTLTTGIFSSSNSNTRVLTMTGASVVVLGSANAWFMSTSTNATVNGSGSTVSMNSASAKTFNGGGQTFGTLVQGGAGTLTIASSNTFENISNTVQPATVRLATGTTQTVSAFSLSGTSGNLVTLDTTLAGTRATLSAASGTVSVSFVSIKDIDATGGATWDALLTNGNVDAGNNLGWNFGAVVARMIFRQVFRPVFSEIFRPIF